MPPPIAIVWSRRALLATSCSITGIHAQWLFSSVASIIIVFSLENRPSDGYRRATLASIRKWGELSNNGSRLIRAVINKYSIGPLVRLYDHTLRHGQILRLWRCSGQSDRCSRCLPAIIPAARSPLPAQVAPKVLMWRLPEHRLRRELALSVRYQ
jgi:hypothetical protein